MEEVVELLFVLIVVYRSCILALSFVLLFN